ncbi:BrnA antitoxin family protein [Zoogloea sp.]|uniref:BrnA antitoxin family protein n=1 Tax=Zoogloea sp. TaxID=49181 RepID=UPI002601B58E|nr:BrnA antitoxin family protein [Zoogloea sp.]MDD3354340.1 BrnA antitoxin family protein [Zoogloea sp.]
MSKARSSKLTPPAQIEELKALSGLPDEAIDYSDIPVSTPANWQQAQVGQFYRPIKQQLTLRIDADVVGWFKAQQDKGYQTRINELLRRAMLENGKR